MSALVALAWGLCAAPMARAEIVDIVWDAQGRHERRADVAPGKFVEACGKLAEGTAVRWRFEAGAPLDFNIHYHVGKQVVYPARNDGVTRADGRLAVALAQDYCWMWSNKTAAPVALHWRLER